MYLPLLFRSGLACVVVGGGQVASHKIRILLESLWNVTVIAPEISDSIAAEMDRPSIRWVRRRYASGDCEDCQLVIAATPDRDVNRRVSEEAKQRNIPVNVVDDPGLSTVIFPAVWREKSLSVAVSTEGAAPFLAAEIRTRIAHYARGFGEWVEVGRRFRESVKKGIPNTAHRNALYKKFVRKGPSRAEDSADVGMDMDDWLAWLDGKRNRKK